MFSYGMVLYELLSGHRPVLGQHQLQIAKKLSKGIRPVLGLPEEVQFLRLQALMVECWDTKPEQVLRGGGGETCCPRAAPRFHQGPHPHGEECKRSPEPKSQGSKSGAVDPSAVGLPLAPASELAQECLPPVDAKLCKP